MSKRAAGYKYKGSNKRGAKESKPDRKACSADAHGQNDWADVGGHSGDGVMGEKPQSGAAGSGKSVHHAAAKSKENVSPPNAHDHADFGGVGGSSKNTNEY